MSDTNFSSPPVKTRTPLVAVVDDDPDILDLVSTHLRKAGMKVREFGESESLFRFLHQDIPDLIVLDLMLPDTDGVEVCRYLRKEPRFAALPVIMLTAKADELDRVLGLEMGADDYVTKPFSPKELIARVKAVLRRSHPEEREAETTTLGEMVVIDPKRHAVTVNGDAIDLTAVEFRILQFLASKPGWVFSRDSILDFLWGHEKAVTDRTVDVHIRHLREKLGAAASIIKNVRGVGYKLEIS